MSEGIIGVASAATLFFPLDKALRLVDHYCSPGMISQALRIGAEIPSFRRAAKLFSELTQVPLSKSTLQRMSQAYGSVVDDERSAEATAMVRVPSRDDEVHWRKVPEPDSPMMNVSSDGTMIHLRDEGWKEVKTVAISAVKATIDDATGAIDVQLANHSYRAGLWEAKDFANQLWAESCQRGLEKATQVTSVNDGALWIWAIVWMCFAHCIPILDWWHAVQYLWTIARVAFHDDPLQSKQWVEAQKRAWPKAISARSCTMSVCSSPEESLCQTPFSKRSPIFFAIVGACVTANFVPPVAQLAVAPLNRPVSSLFNSV